MSVLVLLDFSSAFDTIDHSMPMHCLHTNVRFNDTVFQLCSSYVTDRKQLCLYQFIVLLFLLKAQMSFMVQYMGHFLPPCILNFCLLL